ncbi:MAG: HEAT repeat domain-containing protein, partial [Ignavibacteria bacterium]|nr:HEAT repeat domain-containing protein [Ignavibacteria bacterium]
GGTRGVGVLADLAGNDQYIGASPFVDALRYESHYTTFTQGAALGYRPIASGGVGLLLEYSGNDNYVTDIYGQGTGYWFGLGAIADLAGEDRYQAYQYAQGAGVHFATGLVRDYEGADVYVSHGVSQGCGHDVALGALIDESGNDVYVCESLSLGGGNANAVSLFVDVSGSDSYIAQNTSNTMGFSDFRRSYGMIGVFVDGGGEDFYSETIRNNTTSIKSSYGVFSDVTGPPLLPSPSPSPTYVYMPLADDIDSLFIQASAAPLKYQNNVKPAREKIAGMGKEALPLLSSYFQTAMPRERLTLEDVLPKIHAAFPDTTRLVMIEGLQSENLAEIALMCTVAGKVKDSTLTPYFISLSRDTSWKVRRTAAQTMSEIKDTLVLPTLEYLLDDPHPLVRSRAAFALGQVGGFPALASLRQTLDEEDQVVRYGAIEGLNRGVKRNISELVSIWQTITTVPHVYSAHRLLFCADTTDKNLEGLVQYIKTAPFYARQNMYRLLASADVFWQRNAYLLARNEDSTELTALIAPYVTTYPAPPKSKKKKR